MQDIGITLTRHIIEGEHKHKGATGEFSILLQQISLAGRILAREIGRAALVGKLGLADGGANPTGDAQKKLDVYANEVMVLAFAKSLLVAGIASEELAEAEEIGFGADAKYLLCMDPIDGSGNIDVNGPLGTIFGIYRRERPDVPFTEADFLRPGSELLAAGYLLYGASTTLVYTVGDGVHGFTLDQGVGEFMLSHPDIRCPRAGRLYCANTGLYPHWDAGVRNFVDYLNEHDEASGRPYTLRAGGAIVADVHRCLIEGGVVFHPADHVNPDGKLRLLYECAPMAFIVEHAGGAASDGTRNVLDKRPLTIHEKTPIAIGSADDVARYRSFVQRG